MGVSLALLVLLRTECLWYQRGGIVWVAFIFAIPALIVWLVGLLGVSTVRGVRGGRAHGRSVFIAPVVCALALIDSAFNPLGVYLDCERFRSPVVARACYEGTMNQATLKLRKNGRFDLVASSILNVNVRNGTWMRTDDTLRLIYDRPTDQTKREDIFWVSARSFTDPLLSNVDTVWVTSTFRAHLGVTMEWCEAKCQGLN